MNLENENKSVYDREYLDSCILKLPDGNEEAFEALYRLTASSVYSYALSVLKDKEDAEDILHDVYVKVYSAAAGYKPCGKPLNWILTVTKNLCFEKLRERTKYSDLPEEEWERGLSENTGISVEERLLLRKCMTVLSSEERQIVVLHAVAGFKHKEIAEQLKLRLSTVLSKYNRAIKKLKEELEKEGL